MTRYGSAWLCLAVAFSCEGADNGYGKINISGVVVDAPCSISPGADNIQVNFGDVSASALQNGHESAAVDFSLDLLRCSTSLKNRVRVTFQGTAFSDGLFSVGPDNTTVGIAVRDRFGQQVLNNQPVAWQRINNGDNQLHFSSVLKGRAAVVSSGSFQTQVLFTVEYL